MTNHSETIDPHELLNQLSFCVFDLETTGGNHKIDKIIEIGLIKIKNLKIIDEKNLLINPQIKIPDFIQNLTNISHADVQTAPIIEDVIEDILHFMGDSILVAHNTSFDIPFFNSVLKRLGKKPLKNKSICTNLMTKYLIPNLLNSNLNYMSKIFDIPHVKAHRALDDAMASANLLLRYLDIFIHKGINKINHLYYPRNRFELDRKHIKKEEGPSEVLKTIKKIQSSFLITLKGDNGLILFSLPCKNDSLEMAPIEEALKKYDWKIATIRLFGPFMEAFIYFNSLFEKLVPETQEKVTSILAKVHKIDLLKNEHFEIDQMADFFICHHLVPEQFIIYPLFGLHTKNQLLFRYPGHKKKMIQFITSKSNRLAQNKVKKIIFNAQYNNLLNKLLKKAFDDKNSSEVFFFKRNIVLTTPNVFLESFETFERLKRIEYPYPKEYL